MFDPRSGAKKVVAPVTARMDRYLGSLIEHIQAARDDVLAEIAAAEARESERHFTLSTRLSAIENRLRDIESTDR